ncbi:hypothetical protein ABVF61_22330 [Roseibium sp. HPY-6]|uniref:hypothetical protein n=1 Tax=Roseibium sp. HPY-6 TaxID=3229852 RepID=UPI00338FDD8C
MQLHSWRKHPAIVMILLAFWVSAQTVSFSLAAVGSQDLPIVTAHSAEDGETWLVASIETQSPAGQSRPCVLTCFANADVCLTQCATQTAKVSVAERISAASTRLPLQKPATLAGETVPVEPAPPKTFG